MDLPAFQGVIATLVHFLCIEECAAPYLTVLHRELRRAVQLFKPFSVYFSVKLTMSQGWRVKQIVLCAMCYSTAKRTPCLHVVPKRCSFRQPCAYFLSSRDEFLRAARAIGRSWLCKRARHQTTQYPRWTVCATRKKVWHACDGILENVEQRTATIASAKVQLPFSTVPHTAECSQPIESRRWKYAPHPMRATQQPLNLKLL